MAYDPATPPTPVAKPDSSIVCLSVQIDATEAEAKVAKLTAQVDELIGKLEKCAGLCGQCTLTVGADNLSAVLDTAGDYRQMRSA